MLPAQRRRCLDRLAVFLTNHAMPTPQPSVSCAYARALLDCLRGDGVDPRNWYGAEAVQRLDDAAQRMPLTDWLTMFEQAVRRTGDPQLPLRVGQAIQPHHYGVLGYLTMSAANLLEAIQRLERYEQLVGEISHSQLIVDGSRARLIWRAPPGSPDSPLLATSSLAGWISYARWLLGRPGQPCDVDFAHADRGDAAAARQLFGGEVRYGQADYALRFELALLRAPVTHADPQLQAMMQQQADAQLLALRSEPEWLQTLYQAIDRGLPVGQVRLADVAPQSARSLQRQLAAAGLSYQQALDRRREARARQLLTDERLSLTDIAFLLGYAEHSAFSRAFSRWTGESPARWRRRQRAGIGDESNG